MSSISVPNSGYHTSYSNNQVAESDDVINGDDAFHVAEDDDDVSLEGLDDDDDFSTLDVSMCIICHRRPSYSKGGRSYPTCGLTCARILENGANAPSHRTGQYGRGASRAHGRGTYVQNALQSRGARSSEILDRFGSTAMQIATSNVTLTPAPRMRTCVICLVKPCYDTKFVTCGQVCTEELCKNGSKLNMCDYCHRKPKLSGYNQCGTTCRDSAKVACLLCKSRPKFGRYHLCGQTCKKIATKRTPLILEAPPDHSTYNLVEQKFKSAWQSGTAPTIKKIYKVIENKSFLVPYDQYKKRVGNEVFRYHGTRQSCTLGAGGNTQLCASTSCALCSILRTSFKVSLANPSGSFGAGIYSSSAASKARGYSSGAIILTKVVLGKVYDTSAGTVRSCPTGYDSVGSCP
ncbi:hypothetical protein BYT27DRAFT_7228876 [Phlegmacium glaucopus]|nr:hypothetical protein BYT27DRAFT_7228876 [Phlegmacium glaucopus]